MLCASGVPDLPSPPRQAAPKNQVDRLGRPSRAQARSAGEGAYDQLPRRQDSHLGFASESCLPS
jgi:hypothetical protein